VQAEDNVVKLERKREAPPSRPSFEELFLDVHGGRAPDAPHHQAPEWFDDATVIVSPV
jgi:hypothetical protein